MKYMVMTFGGVGEVLATKTPAWIANKHTFVEKLDQELKESGEVGGGGRFVDPTQATTVRFEDGIPVPTDRAAPPRDRADGPRRAEVGQRDRQQAVSLDLKVLRDCGLVRVERLGQRRLYLVDPDGFDSLRDFPHRRCGVP
jgi:hypothetical protein